MSTPKLDGQNLRSNGSPVITDAQKGAANGVATLDGTTKIPNAQTTRGDANGLASLDGTTKVPIGELPAGTANGVASLDGSGKVPVAQLPAGAASQVEFDSIATGDYLPVVTEDALVINASTGVTLATDSDGNLEVSITSLLASQAGRIFIPIDPTKWLGGSIGADQILEVETAMKNVSGDTAVRSGMAFRVQAGFGGGMYVLAFEHFEPDNSGNPGSQSQVLLRETALKTYTELVGWPTAHPTFDAGVDYATVALFGGARGNLLYGVRGKPQIGIRETAAAIAGAGQWGLWMETYGAGSCKVLYRKVVGMSVGALNPVG